MRVPSRGLAASVIGCVLVLAAQAGPVSADGSGDSVTGTLVETVADDFAAGADVEGVGVIPDGDPSAFVPLAGVTAGDLAATAGDRVRVRGTLRRGSLAVRPSGVAALSDGASADASDGPGTAGPGTDGPETAEVTTSTSVLAITVKFSDSSTTPESTSSIRTKLFGESGSVADYYSEVSAGQETLTGTVRGPYTITRNDSGCGYEDYVCWSIQADAKAKAAGVDPASYDHVMVIWPTTSTYGWAGLGHIDGPRTWINQTTPSVLVMTHELGHNFGLHHASALRCRDGSGARVAMSSRCSTAGLEYADPFSAMGNRSTGLHHAIHRQDLGFLPMTTIPRDTSATVDLAPLYASSGVRALRIPRDGSSSYVVEYRRPFGSFDVFSGSSAVATGLTIRIDRGTVNRSRTETWLVDTTPETDDFRDAPLQVGATFADPATGMRLSLDRRTDTVATVSVTWPVTWRDTAADGLVRAGRPDWRPPGS